MELQCLPQHLVKDIGIEDLTQVVISYEIYMNLCGEFHKFHMK